MLKVYYFASIREFVGIEQEELEYDPKLRSVSELISLLSERHEGFNQAREQVNTLLVAVNQTIVAESYELTSGDEVAFFPPMTGG